MDPHEQVTNLIYDALQEINEKLKPEQALKIAPETVLIGESGLDSLGIVTLTAAVEEKIKWTFNKDINLVDVLMSAEEPQWTAARLADWIAGQVDGAGHEQQPAGDSVEVDGQAVGRGGAAA